MMSKICLYLRVNNRLIIEPTESIKLNFFKLTELTEFSNENQAKRIDKKSINSV